MVMEIYHDEVAHDDLHGDYGGQVSLLELGGAGHFQSDMLTFN